MVARIKVEDVQAAGFCVRGARRWFEGHGIDFADFLTNGVSVEQLRQTRDPLAEKVIERTESRRG